MLWRVTASLISEVIAASPSEALANRSHRLGLKFKNELTRTIRRNGKYIDISLMKLVGCDNKTFRTHIESQFDESMSWSNRGKRGWHFAYIRPSSTFNLLNDEERKVCFNYRNIQPLWSTSNPKERLLQNHPR